MIGFTGPGGATSCEFLMLDDGARFDSMNAVGELESPVALPADVVGVSSSASSAAGRLRCLPHISSRRSGGAAAIGCSVSTVPSDGLSQLTPLRLKPRSSMPAVLAPRTGDDGEPSVTAISLRPLR